jgi:hypothetical protein
MHAELAMGASDACSLLLLDDLHLAPYALCCGWRDSGGLHGGHCINDCCIGGHQVPEAAWATPNHRLQAANKLVCSKAFALWTLSTHACIWCLVS